MPPIRGLRWDEFGQHLCQDNLGFIECAGFGPVCGDIWWAAGWVSGAVADHPGCWHAAGGGRPALRRGGHAAGRLAE